MSALEDLDLGRQAHLRQQWAQSFEVLSDIDARDPLGPGDCELAAEAASMLGRGDDEVRLLRRAFLGHADAGSVGAALRCGYWLYKALAWAGEFAQAGAWLAKARRLAEADPDCCECGYLLMLDAELDLRAGRNAEMLVVARRLVDVAREGGDADLAAGAAMTLGSALILNGTIEPGLTHLDEAMVAVTGGDLSARSTGMIYCVVIGICQELYDLRRAREWSDALAAWSQAQPDFTGAYRGLCRVHRAAILQLGGGWPGAVREARLACQQLSGRYGQMVAGGALYPLAQPCRVAGGAFYQLAELYRLRGELSEADEAYREAVRLGWDVQPGLSLLRLAQGRRPAAAAAIRRALAEATGVRQRSRVLPAAVDILLAVEDVSEAARAAAELSRIADEYDVTALQASAASAEGAVRLAEGSPEQAAPALRRAFRLWRELDVPYEAARVRVLVAAACRALGDEDSAAMEVDAA